MRHATVSRLGVAIATLAVLPAGLSQSADRTVSLTIYNQNFAVARTTVDLNLRQGSTEVTTTDVTSQLEPDSVVLRDPAGKHDFSVVEQNYDAGIVNQDWLLAKYEGKTVDFQVNEFQNGLWAGVVKPGKIIRASPPLVEFEGHMQFQLPGTPLFPASTEGLLLKPTLRWQIASDQAATFPAELSYITRGFSWSANYNLVADAGTGGSSSEPMDLVGWVTMNNNSGVDFPSASVQLVAGNVAKVIEPGYAKGAIGGVRAMTENVAVTQENFDDFHLYNLNRTTSLRNGETKQVEFLTANRIPVTRSYEYEASPRFYGGVLTDPASGGEQNTRVTIANEFTNSTANHLGVPMPAGRVRLYRRDSHGAIQFAGEANIDHTPRNEKVRFVTGDAFDITATRTQTDFHVESSRREMDESFEIKVKNQKDAAVTVDVIEHLYRAANWAIAQSSQKYAKRDVSTIVFPVEVRPQSSSTVTYTVHYTW